MIIIDGPPRTKNTVRTMLAEPRSPKNTSHSPYDYMRSIIMSWNRERDEPPLNQIET